MAGAGGWRTEGPLLQPAGMPCAALLTPGPCPDRWRAPCPERSLFYWPDSPTKEAPQTPSPSPYRNLKARADPRRLLFQNNICSLTGGGIQSPTALLWLLGTCSAACSLLIGTHSVTIAHLLWVRHRLWTHATYASVGERCYTHNKHLHRRQP